MGAGQRYDDGISIPLLPGRENDAAAGGGPAPSVPSPAAAPLPGMARAVRSLTMSWGRVYVIAACLMPDRTERWTAVSHDGLRVVTADGDWVILGRLLREDYGRYPADGDGLRPGADFTLDRVRAGHPGFAVVAVTDGARAFRGSESWPPAHLPAVSPLTLGNLLCAQEFEDARLSARLDRRS